VLVFVLLLSRGAALVGGLRLKRSKKKYGETRATSIIIAYSDLILRSST
jgi:hypothetical protein